MNRLRVVTTCIAVGLIGTTPGRSDDPTPIGSWQLDLASAYVFRGATVNDRAVLQPALEVGVLPRLSLGIWGNLDRRDDPRQEFTELDLTATYGFELQDLGISLTYTEYVYPAASSRGDREIALGLEWPAVITPSVTIAYGVGGAIQKDLYMEIGPGIEPPLIADVTLTLGTSVAYRTQDDRADGWSHYTLSVGLQYGPIGAGLAYIGRIERDVLGDAYDTRWLANVSLRRSF